MRSLIVVALTLTVFAAAGCSGDDDADPTTTREPNTTVVATSEPDATAPPTTERPTTTNAPTTAAPTTTIDPTEALIADIEADLNAGEQALFVAGAAPADPASRELAQTYFSGESLASIEQTLASLIDNGLVARPNPETPNVIVVRALVDADTSEATIDLCRVDAGMLVEVLPSGVEVIVNDTVSIYQSRSVVKLKDDIWVLDSGEPLENVPAVATCE